jgi:hypothetical protein
VVAASGAAAAARDLLGLQQQQQALSATGWSTLALLLKMRPMVMEMGRMVSSSSSKGLAIR